MAFDIHEGAGETEGLFLATQVGQLQRLELRPPAEPIAVQLWREQLQQEEDHQAPPLWDSPFNLGWLRQNKQLQHVSATLIQTGEVCWEGEFFAKGVPQLPHSHVRSKHRMAAPATCMCCPGAHLGYLGEP
jgi:hypothetical protein